MSINRLLADRASENDLISQALRLSMATTIEWSRDYMGEDGNGVFPHERGSIDTYDDMRASLRLTYGLLDAAFDEVERGQQFSTMQRIVREENALAALTDELTKLIFPGWSEDQITDFVLSIDEGGK